MNTFNDTEREAFYLTVKPLDASMAFFMALESSTETIKKLSLIKDSQTQLQQVAIEFERLKRSQWRRSN
jgi:hypothetical protein